MTRETDLGPATGDRGVGDRRAGDWSDRDAVARAAAMLGDAARLDAPLGALTTSRVGGPAAIAFSANDIADLERVRRAAAETGLAVLVTGRGSNLLVADRGFEGIALFLGDGFDHVTPQPETGIISAGGATALPVLARRSAAAGIGGLEWAVGIPGSVGGAIRMNAGGHGSDVASCLADAEIFDLAADGDAYTCSPDALELGYRTSCLGDSHVVTGARFQGRPADPADAMAQIAEIVRWRRTHQPGGQNAGSVFMNPPKGSAGEQIDRAGLSGLRIGSAQVSRLHANFIVSDPGGSAADVVALMAEVRRGVADATGIELQPEIRLVGFGPSPLAT